MFRDSVQACPNFAYLCARLHVCVYIYTFVWMCSQESEMMFQPESDQTSPGEPKVGKHTHAHNHTFTKTTAQCWICLSLMTINCVFKLIFTMTHSCLQSPPLDLIDTGKGLKVQTAAPHLVSLGSGRLSVAITVLPLKEGSTHTHTHTYSTS